jgi:uncharacterized membrane protein YfhO
MDGEWAKMESPMGILRGVELPQGDHLVEFIYRPVSLYIGLLLSCFGMLWLGWKYLRK